MIGVNSINFSKETLTSPVISTLESQRTISRNGSKGKLLYHQKMSREGSQGSLSRR